jgi:hypothetical protein
MLSFHPSKYQEVPTCGLEATIIATLLQLQRCVQQSTFFFDTEKKKRIDGVLH